MGDRSGRGWVTGANRRREARGSDRQRAPKQCIQSFRFQRSASVVLSSRCLAARQQSERAVERRCGDPDWRRRWQGLVIAERVPVRVSRRNVRSCRGGSFESWLRSVLRPGSAAASAARACSVAACPAVGFDVAGVALGNLLQDLMRQPTMVVRLWVGCRQRDRWMRIRRARAPPVSGLRGRNR